MPALWASHHASGMTLGAQAQLRQLPRHPLRMPRRAHLGEEVMGLAKLAGASRGVFEQPGQRCVLDVDQGLDGSIPGSLGELVSGV